MSSSEIADFRKIVQTFWKKEGRHALPWRRTEDPYKILVSEIMLQQTQVDRVLPYYKRFLEKFPTVQKLAKAELSEILKLWSGLGYNRRAKYLRDAAKAVVEVHGGKFPHSYEELRKLSGVGDYTARAVRVFAFNEPDILIETNIRTAFFHHMEVSLRADGREVGGISDSSIMSLALKAARGQDPRTWHWALMDYGAFLKKSGVQLNDKSKHYTKQSKFEGSFRQLRGRLLRRLVDGPITNESFKGISAKYAYKISMALFAMEKEGLVVKTGDDWELS